MPKLFLSCALALGLLLPGAALAGDDEALQIPYEAYELDNGLQVILHEDHRLPLVAVNVWYHVAAFHEVAGRSGFAHLFEHMMFQGSKHVGDDQHFKILERIGATGMNGTTSFDRTNYFETVPAHHLETGLWLESDRMGYLLPSMDETKLKNQQEVVKNERRQSYETRPYGLAEEALWKALFPAPHPYNGMVIGSMDELAAATLEDVSDFFRTWYAPSNATLVLAGDFDPAQAKALIEKYFGSFPKVPKPEAPVVAPVAIEKETVIEFVEPIAPLPKVEIAWLTPSFFQPGDAEADVLSSVLATGESSLLQRRLVRELQIAQSVMAYQYSMGAQSTFFIEAVARPGVDAKQLLTEIDKVLEEVQGGAVTADQLRRAVNRYETQFFSRLQQLGGFGGRADLLQTYNHFLADPGFLPKDIARYRAVTPEAVTAFSKDYLAKNKRVVLFAVPAAAAAPEANATAAAKEAN
ncbi:MAG: pitrilysin family protein [Deltaproteobacteria bacterium]|nr:pitrilysin family protein [Deltaproteobacteria bacterium]